MNNDKISITSNQDELAGTTNLSLDHLKKEGGQSGQLIDVSPDDLNEIRAADDLDEPDTEEYQPEITSEEPQPDSRTDGSANPAKLDS